MKILHAFLAFSLAATAASAQTADIPKLSPSTRRYLAAITDHVATSVLPDAFVYKQCNGRPYISALVEVSDPGAAAKSLEAMQAHVGTKAGTIWTVQVPIEKVAFFAQAHGIRYVELDEPVVVPAMDVARKTTRVDSVHNSVGLPMPYFGTGVVVGVMDFGFDYKHPLFWDTTGTRYRLKKVWEQGGNGTPPTGYSYGRELGDTATLKLSTTDNSQQTHGTSVAGMAVGSGIGTANNSRWRGMAPEADVVMVGVRRDSIGGQWLKGGFSDFIEGIDYMFKYAQSVGKPIVVNVSWGSQSGPHDGTSLFNKAIDALTGPGKILVMSAGNNGRDRIHLGKTFTATDTAVATFLNFSPGNYKRTWIDAWGDTGKTWCADATLYRNGLAVSQTVSVCLDNNTHNKYLTGTNTADTCFLQFLNETASYNGKPRSTIAVFNKTGDTLRLRYRATSGRINMWNEYYYYGYDYGFQSTFAKNGMADAVDGDTATTISDMGAGKSVILVGAYVTRTSWTTINGVGLQYPASYAPLNKLAAFSSFGPYVDGRIKPDIAAPGLTVATALSSYDTAYTATGSNKDYVRSSYSYNGRTYYYGEFSGTSAAAPAASGIIALMLQAKPTLTPDSVKAILFETAIKDIYTGVIPAAGLNSWGHGKINAYGALKKLAQATTTILTTGQSAPDCTLFPNPSSGTMILHHSGALTEMLTVQVYNAFGILMQQKQWSVGNGLSVMEMPTAGLAAGIYLIRVQGAGGSITIRAVVQ